MRMMTAAAAMIAAFGIATTAQAAEAGDIQVKVMATGVLPNGEIDEVKIDNIGLPAGTNTEANDNVVPTLAIEYFASKNFSIETICCFTTHGVKGTGAIAGAEIADHVMILPATVTLKYHLDAGAIKPYIGAGPSIFFFIDEKPGATAQILGAESLKIDNTFGVALQAGVDIPMGEGLGISLDAKRYFMKPTTHFYDANGDEALSTKHKLDPWVVSGGVYFSF